MGDPVRGRNRWRYTRSSRRCLSIRLVVPENMGDIHSIVKQHLNFVLECGGGAPKHRYKFESRLWNAGVDARWGDLVIVVPGKVALWGRPYLVIVGILWVVNKDETAFRGGLKALGERGREGRGGEENVGELHLDD